MKMVHGSLRMHVICIGLNPENIPQSEEGDVRSIFANPSHPYTRGLLASIPKLGEYAEELESIPGNVPNPKYMPQGCKFAPRCSCAFDKCREEEPGFYDVGGGHMSRCWLCEKKGGDA